MVSFRTGFILLLCGLFSGQTLPVAAQAPSPESPINIEYTGTAFASGPAEVSTGTVRGDGVRLSPAYAAGVYETTIAWTAQGQITPDGSGSDVLSLTDLKGSIRYYLDASNPDSRDNCDGGLSLVPGSQLVAFVDRSVDSSFRQTDYSVRLQAPLDERFVQSDNTTNVYCMIRNLSGLGNPAPHPNVPESKVTEYQDAAEPSLQLPFYDSELKQQFNYDYTGADTWFRELDGAFGPPVGTFSAYIHSTVSIGKPQGNDPETDITGN